MKKYYCLILLVFSIFQNSMGKGNFKNPTNNKNPKEVFILEKALDLILNEKKDYIYLHKKLAKEDCFLHININEEGDFQEFKCYTIYFSETGLSDTILPSYLIKKKGVYCAIYERKEDTMLKRKIPKKLFKDCEDGLSNEDSWMVLICKRTFKYIVVNNGLVPFKAIKQFQNFSCNDADSKSDQSKIEKGIVDHFMMDSIIRR